MPRQKIPNPQSHAKDVAESIKRERPDLDPSDYLYLIYIMRLGRILGHVDDQRCRKNYGISGADMRVLYALRRAGAPYSRRPTELFRSLLVTSGAITKQVDRLVRLKLVSRSADPSSKGSFLVSLTKKGKNVADSALTSLAKFARPSKRSSLSRAEHDKMCALCEKMLLDLEKIS
jgi:DNA-binding MarR family transcriptional regulator